MKVFDLFCGTGGFSKGFESSNKGIDFDVVFGIDLLKPSVSLFGYSKWTFVNFYIQ